MNTKADEQPLTVAMKEPAVQIGANTVVLGGRTISYDSINDLIVNSPASDTENIAAVLNVRAAEEASPISDADRYVNLQYEFAPTERENIRKLIQAAQVLQIHVEETHQANSIFKEVFFE